MYSLETKIAKYCGFANRMLNYGKKSVIFGRININIVPLHPVKSIGKYGKCYKDKERFEHSVGR